MKVFCRFAPPTGSSSTTYDSHNPLLSLRAEAPTSATAASSSSAPVHPGHRVYLADPVTLSKASFSCDGVFLPTFAGAPLDQRRNATDEGSCPGSRSGTYAQQELLYSLTCRNVLNSNTSSSASVTQQQYPSSTAASTKTPAQQRHIYLAYGQTASGKTYSLFGDLAFHQNTSVPAGAGVVPRYLHDVFHMKETTNLPKKNYSNGEKRTSVHAKSDCVDDIGDESGVGVFVDLSCFEVYNEVTTDLVALSTSLCTSATATATTATRRLRHSATSASSSPPSTSAAAAAAATLQSDLQRQQAPVWAARNCYRDEQLHSNADDGGSRAGLRGSRARAQPSPGDDEESWATRSDTNTTITTTSAHANVSSAAAPTATTFVKTEYKSTEKQQVLRCVERARCGTFAEALAVLQALLRLRQECATSRNQSSSRGHLVVRVEVYAADAANTSWWVRQREIAFVDLAGSESGRLTEADPTLHEPFCHPSSSSAYSAQVALAGGRRGRSSGPPSRHHSLLSTSRASSQHSRASHDTSAASDGSSRHSSGSRRSSSSHHSGSSSHNNAYHRYLLHPPQEEDVKAVRARRLRETRCINASLLALRKVFRALYEATQSAKMYGNSGGGGAVVGAAPLRRPPLHHAPFKDSTLTAILEPFLIPQPASTPADPAGPTRAAAAQAHVVLLVCCSSRSADFFETVASLRLGAEATAVNPEVVLRALPVQQREQQQQQQQQQMNENVQSTNRGLANSGGRRYVRSASGPQPLFRSASAPHQRLLLHATQPTSTSAEGSRDVNSKVPVTQLPGASTSAGSASGTNRTSQEVEQLKAEVQRYRSTAQQLYTQCKSLCQSYDECVDELGKCRALLTEKDTRIAELERLLTASQQATAASSKVLCGGEGGKGGSSSPAARLPEQQQQQQAEAQQFYRMRRVSQEDNTSTKSAVMTAMNKVDGSPHTLVAGGLMRPTRSASRCNGAFASRAVSNSTAREESARCLVSLSPFSTTSAMTGTARRRAIKIEDANTSSSSSSDELDEGVNVCSKTPSSPSVVRATDDTAETTGVGKKITLGGSATASGSRIAQQQQQQQQARSIMNTLLSRQIFPTTVTRDEQQEEKVKATKAAEAASAIASPARESSPSPVLPTLTAHTSSTATASRTPSTSAAQTRRHGAQAVVVMTDEYTSVKQGSSPLSSASLCPSCAQGRPSGGSGDAASGGATASESANRSCSNDHTCNEGAENSSSGAAPPRLEKEAHLHAATGTVVVDAAASPLAHNSEQASIRKEEGRKTRRVLQEPMSMARERESSSLPTHAVVSPSEDAGACVIAMSMDRSESRHHCSIPEKLRSDAPADGRYRGDDNTSRSNNEQAVEEDADDVQEIVISYHGSPAARAIATSMGSAGRSRSSAYTVLMPPSPSCSPAGSRSPSSHTSYADATAVYQL